MGKQMVINKSFAEKYWDSYIEKAMSHKYIRKVPNSKGGYYYIYPKDFAKPLKVLLSVFGLKEEKIDDTYAKQNIQAEYGADKKTFAAHLLEYLSNRSAWNKFFGQKFNRDKYKDPVKFEAKKSELKTKVENGEIKNNGKTTDKTNPEHNEPKEKDFKSKWNNTLMRKIYSMYNPVPEDKKNEAVVIANSSNRVSKNGRTGTITKDYGNGFVFVNFDDGGMGKLKRSDLQDLEPTNQSVTVEADVNGASQDVNGTNQAVKEEIYPEDEVVIEKPGFNKIERAAITILYEQYKKQLENQYSGDLLNLKIGSKIIEEYPELDAHGEVRRTMVNVRRLAFDKKLLPDVVKFIKEKNVKGNNPLEENKVHEKTQEEKMKEWHEKWDVKLADEFIQGKQKYLNAKPIVSVNAMILFDKIWDSLKDKTKNEQLKGLYNAVKDDYVMSWNDSLKARKEGLTPEEIRFGYINAFLETKNAAEEKHNQAIKDSQKEGIKLNFKINHEEHSLEDLKKLKIDIQDNIKMLADDEYALPEDRDRLNAQLEAVDEMIAERDTSALSQAMMGNQNARKYGNLSEEANQIIENNNLPVNADGVVQPTETQLKTSNDYWKKHETESVKFSKDQYGNTLITMPGITGIAYDENGNRVEHTTMIHQRTYHDEYIPEEPNFSTNGIDGDTIYLTPELKQKMLEGNTDYIPVNPDYKKPEVDSYIEDYIGNLTKDKEINALSGRKGAMKHIYEMGKDKGLHIIPVMGIMSNHGPVTNAILPIDENDPMSDNAVLIDKSDKALIPFAEHVIDTVKPENELPKGQNVLLSQTEKNILAMALKLAKQNDPTMADSWYEEKVKEKFKMAERVDNWKEIWNNDFVNMDEQAIRDYAADVDKKEDAVTEKDALENYVSGNGMWVNKYLRDPEKYIKDNGELNDSDKNLIEDLRVATTTEKLQQKKLWRSVDASAVFGDISDLDFENLQASVVYGNKDKLYAGKVDSLINNAAGKEITEKGFMSTTKDKDIAENWNGYTGSNKDITLELNIPDGMTGKDLSEFEVAGGEQKEVLLPDNVDYKVTEITKGDNGNILVKCDVLGVHGNHFAMLGNQNARKDGLTQDEADSLEYYVQDAGYTYINDKLRGVDETPLEENHNEAIKNIDNVIGRNTVKEKTLYRGIGGNTIFPTMNPYEHRLMELYLSNKDAYNSMKNDDWFDGPKKYTGAKDNVEKYLKDIIGKTFTDKGYVSTSKTFDETKTFSDSHKNGITIEFQNIPENTHGVDLSSFQEGREFKDENEVLLHRNLNYKITGVKSVDGKIVLTAEILPESDAEKIQNRSEAMMGNDNAKKWITDIPEGTNLFIYGKDKEGDNKFHAFSGGSIAENLMSASIYNKENIGNVINNFANAIVTNGLEGKVEFQVRDSKGKVYYHLTKDNIAEILPESDAEKTQNRSEAMMGNDNAAGKHNVKPQTEKQMKDEQKREKENRKKAGLPNPGNNVGDRISAIDDAAGDSWDPNSENYRFKDTGYIAGSRKELASTFIIERAKSGSRIAANEIDFDGIEENPRAAEKLITKSNIFGDVNWDELREKGMSGSAAFLIDRVYASAGAKPDESTPNARKQYVIALNGLRDRLEDCKTVPEVLDELKDIRDEIRGEFVEIKDSEEYKKLTNQMSMLRTVVYNKKKELEDLSEQGRKTYDVEYQKVVEKYIQKGKDEKLLKWNSRVSRYNIPKQYEEAFNKETSGIWDQAYKPWKDGVAKFKEELIARGVKEDEFFRDVTSYRVTAVNGKEKVKLDWYDYYKLMPENKEYEKLEDDLDELIAKQKIEIKMKNPLLEAWKSLGKRFTDILYSDSFAQHKYDCTKGKYDDWEWVQKDVKVTEKKQAKQKKIFQLVVANSITRKGGRNFDITSTADLKKAFNLRDVQSGNWVLKDPESAEFHVRNAANAFADLADITGIPDDKISLNGRLAMAFGARGTGNAGGSAASAHYEPVERVINLTKFRGGGCLGHEWFHSFDNMITSAMTGDNSKSDIFLTNVYHGLSEPNKLLLQEYIELKNADSTYSNVYRRGVLARQLEKKGIDVSKLDKSNKTVLQIKVQDAFDQLVKAMTTGDADLKMDLVYEGKDYKAMLYNMSDSMIARYRASYGSYTGSRKPVQLLIADAGNLDNAVQEINKRYENYSDSASIKHKKEWLRIAAAYYDRKPDGNKSETPLRVSSGKKGSSFLAGSKELDLNTGKDYWSTTHEMAARAFSAYLEDSLQALGRQSDYLAYGSDNKYYDGDKPFPEGEERKRINAAFKHLFEVINEQNAIQKSIEILDKFILEKSEPRFIIKNGRFLVRK